MGGSAPEAPTSPDAQPSGGMRASDAERDEVVARLKEEFATGRLSKDTFLFRVNEVLKSRHQADLPPLVADLPVLAEPGPSPVAAVQTFLLGRLRAAWPRTRQPLTRVPFVEVRSVSSQPSRVRSSLACRRETVMSEMARSQLASRPMLKKMPGLRGN